MRELFIYYRSAEDQAEHVAGLVGTFQARLMELYPPLDARLLRRVPAQPGSITWMETYSMNSPLPLPGGVGLELQQAIEAHAQVLRPFTDGERHIEVFEPCAC